MGECQDFGFPSDEKKKLMMAVVVAEADLSNHGHHFGGFSPYHVVICKDGIRFFGLSRAYFHDDLDMKEYSMWPEARWQLAGYDLSCWNFGIYTRSMDN